jgi:hypothetical protein
MRDKSIQWSIKQP